MRTHYCDLSKMFLLVLEGRGYQGKTKMAGDRNSPKWCSFVIAELQTEEMTTEQWQEGCTVTLKVGEPNTVPYVF